jgi:hypothetical protein
LETNILLGHWRVVHAWVLNEIGYR